jgi:hypothetical protein
VGGCGGGAAGGGGGGGGGRPPRSGLQQATASVWHIVGDDDAGVDGLFDVLSQVAGRWWCAVSGAFVHV